MDTDIQSAVNFTFPSIALYLKISFKINSKTGLKKENAGSIVTTMRLSISKTVLSNWPGLELL